MGQTMQDFAFFLLVVMASAVVFAPLHIVLGRGCRGAALVRSLGISIAVSTVAGGLFGGGLISGQFSSPAVSVIAAVGGALTFAGFAGAYALILPISVDRSLSAHVVGLVYSSPGGRLSEAELFDLYTHAAILGKRLRECEQSGILERHGDELLVTSKGKRIAYAYFMMDRLMHTGAMMVRPIGVSPNSTAPGRR